MPNWCYTDYRIVGNKKQIKSLHKTMETLENMETSLVKNGFGTTWLGNLVKMIGGDYEKIYCRGKWENLNLSSDCETLHFSTETAWDRCEDFDNFLKSKFPGIRIYYICEEPGMCVYYTNDSEGLYYMHRFVVEVEDYETREFQTKQKAKEYIEEIIGRKIDDSEEDLDKALFDWADDKDTYANYHEFVIVED